MRLVVKVGPATIVDHNVMPEVVATVTVSYGPWLRWLLPLRVRVRIQQGKNVTHAIEIAQ